MHLLLNDTSDYHNGCKAVVQSFDFDMSIKTNEHPQIIPWDQITKVTLNGEGTMHHHTINSKKFLRLLGQAQSRGIHTELVNTVWQQMPHDYDEILQKCERVVVREVLSQEEIRKHGVEAEVIPDRSLLIDVPVEPYSFVDVYEGQYFFKDQKRLGLPQVDVFDMSWNELVNRLRSCSLLITGRHHEMYAAIKAECPVICFPGNTWKNQGLFVSAGVTPQTDLSNIDAILDGKLDYLYDQLITYCNTTIKKY